MKKQLNNYSWCGLDCSNCDAYIATINNDNDLREKTAKRWAEEHHHPGLKTEDINCLGCLSDSEPVFQHCHECEVRKCGKDKGLKSCGECNIYKSCEKIINLHRYIKDGQLVCDRIFNKNQAQKQ